MVKPHLFLMAFLAIATTPTALDATQSRQLTREERIAAVRAHREKTLTTKPQPTFGLCVFCKKALTPQPEFENPTCLTHKASSADDLHLAHYRCHMEQRFEQKTACFDDCKEPLFAGDYTIEYALADAQNLGNRKLVDALLAVGAANKEDTDEKQNVVFQRADESQRTMAGFMVFGITGALLTEYHIDTSESLFPC